MNTRSEKRRSIRAEDSDWGWTTGQCSAAAQAERRERVFALVRDTMRCGLARENGRTVIPAPEHPGDARIHLWLARAFVHGNREERQIGSELIASVEFNHPCHFCGAVSADLLCADKALLSADAVRNLEQFLLRGFSDWMTDDFRFHGANDNAPAGCTVAVALGGQYFSNPDLVAFARSRLRDLDRMLDLRGYIHECNSPTYSAATLMELAALAEHSTDPEIRSMALRAERRVWQELLLHFHPYLRHQMGPFSRGYPDDNAAQCSLVMMTMYAAFGEVSPFNPLNMLFPPAEGSFAHNSWGFQHRSLAAQVAPIYHPPAELAQACLTRRVPFSVTGSNEFMAGWGTPAGETLVHAHAERDWGVSSFGSRTWAGQTVPLHVLLRRRPVAKPAPVLDHLAGIRSIYTRYHVSESFAGMAGRDARSAEAQIHSDHGAAFSVQHGGAAILAYVPMAGPEHVRTMKMSVVLPLHHSRPDEIRHGSRLISGFSGSFAEADWAFVRDGNIYLAFHPLIARQDEAVLCTQMYEDYTEYGMISFYNRCAFEARTLTEKDRRSMGNGMVVEVGDKAQFGAFEKFRAAISEARIVHNQWVAEREIRYRRGAVDLELKIDWQQLNLRRAAVNGRLANTAVKLHTEPALPLVD